VLLVDDVLTTGATLRSAASALKAAGAAHVSALTLARVDRRRFHHDLDLREQPAGQAVVAGGVN
jgi:adenine/guanine phosphoribosyltransferase-like PRPP-binding protein